MIHLLVFGSLYIASLAGMYYIGHAQQWLKVGKYIVSEMRKINDLGMDAVEEPHITRFRTLSEIFYKTLN